MAYVTYTRPYRGRSTSGFYNQRPAMYKKRWAPKSSVPYSKKSAYYASSKPAFYGSVKSGARRWAFSAPRMATKGTTKPRRFAAQNKAMTPTKLRKWQHYTDSGAWKTLARLDNVHKTYKLVEKLDTIWIAESMTRHNFQNPTFAAISTLTDHSVVNLDEETSWTVRTIGIVVKLIGKRDDLHVGQLSEFGQEAAGRQQLGKDKVTTFMAALWGKKDDLNQVDVMKSRPYSDEVEVVLDETQNYKNGTEACTVPEKHNIHTAMILGEKGAPMLNSQSGGCNYIVLRLLRPRSPSGSVTIVKTDTTLGYHALPLGMLVDAPSAPEVKMNIKREEMDYD